MHAQLRVVGLAALAFLSGCAGGSGTQSSGMPEPARKSDIVTLEELSRISNTSTLYEALHALRPAWFRRLPTTLRPESEGDVVVYLDQSRFGGPETLRTLAVTGITAVRYYNPTEAQARFGLGHLHGAIQIITAR
jgi:hypothetical protein